jgi:hypothetical protein
MMLMTAGPLTLTTFEAALLASLGLFMLQTTLRQFKQLSFRGV